MNLLQRYAYKELKYRYWGRDYCFTSSQELFSASQIDRGSQLLLKSLLGSTESSFLKELLQEALEKGRDQLDIWDWGCGIGVLGIMAQGYLSQLLEKQVEESGPDKFNLSKSNSKKTSLNKSNGESSELANEPSSTLHVWDRDALALAFTEANWQVNQGKPFKMGLKMRLKVHSELFRPTEQNKALLLLSNIPAKLGEPVLRQLLPALALHAHVAIVIVAPLRHLVEEAAERGQIEILHRSGSGDHSVFHYRAKYRTKAVLQKLPEALELYKRAESRFCLERCGKALKLFATPSSGKEIKALSWSFLSAYGLSDFDQPSFALQLQIRLLAPRNWGGRILLWETNHGHVACFLALKPGSQVRHIDLAGRNRLALQFSEHNLQNAQNLQGIKRISSRLLSYPCFEALPDSLESWNLVVLPLAEKSAPNQALLEKLQSLAQNLHGKTWLCLEGKSHNVRQIRNLKGWTLDRELRSHGLLAQLWHT